MQIFEQILRLLAEILQIDDRIPIQLSLTGESMINKDNYPGSINPYEKNHVIHGSIPTEFKSDLEIQGEEGTKKIVKKLQIKARDLETKCYQLNQLAQEGSMWKEKYTLLRQEFRTFRNKIIKGTTQIEFGSELFPVTIEYNPPTNQFSARIPQEVIERSVSCDTSRYEGGHRFWYLAAMVNSRQKVLTPLLLLHLPITYSHQRGATWIISLLPESVNELEQLRMN